MEIWASAIGCIGSIVAALIGAIGSIMAARVGREKPHERIEQNQLAHQPIIPDPRRDAQSEDTREPIKAISGRGLQKDKAGVILGITSVLSGITLLCAFSLFLSAFRIPVILLPILAIFLGIGALASRKRWPAITGLMLNGFAIMVLAGYFLVLIIDSGVPGFG